jgi:hypothetical protein
MTEKQIITAVEDAVRSALAETIGGEDYADTDPMACAIIEHLLTTRGVTEQVAARTPYRVLVNMILRAERELSRENR